MDLALDEIDEILLPTRVGKQGVARAIDFAVARTLALDDLSALTSSGALTPVPSKFRNISAARSAHHLLAQLCAEGKSNIEIGLITGYSPAYISKLRSEDPAFRELLAHYAVERERVFVDALERMKALGVASLEELQERLESDPASFKHRELLEIAELMLTKGSGSASPAAPAVSIAVNFVTPPGEGDRSGLIIDSGPRQE